MSFYKLSHDINNFYSSWVKEMVVCFAYLFFWFSIILCCNKENTHFNNIEKLGFA
jgi:hypothetical protein